MLNNKQTLILCGILAVGIFVSGLLEILDNFIAKTIITIIFLIIIINIIVVKSTSEETDETEETE